MRSVGGKPAFESLGAAYAARAEAAVAVDSNLCRNILWGSRLFDCAAVMAAGMLSHRAMFGLFEMAPLVMLLIGFETLLAANVFHFAGLYDGVRVFHKRRHLLAPLWLAPLLALPMTMSGSLGEADLWPGDSLWRWPALWWAMATAAITVGHIAASALLGWLSESQRFVHRVLVVGDLPRVNQVMEFLQERGEGWAVPVDVLIDGDGPALREAARQGYVGRMADIDRVMRIERIDDIIVALPWADQQRMSGCLAKLREFPVDVHLFPDQPSAFMASQGISLYNGIPLVRLSRRPMGRVGAFLKTVEDKMIGLILLAILAPILLVIALAVRLDSPGPVLFRQKRYGYNNQVFTVFKFRSMYVRPQEPAGELGVAQAKRNDPRVTRVGGFLRRTSLDELPQLLNVINGSMSLVGPRPHAVEHQNYYQHLVDEYRSRHRMKPGITGWAQVNGFRGETTDLELMRKRVEYDLDYINRWSILLDLWILILTPIVCLRGNNAY